MRVGWNKRIPFEIQTPYLEKWDYYAAQFDRLAGIVGKERLNGKRALIVGPGRSAEEAALVLWNFPGLEKILMVEWHEPNIEFVKRRLDEIEKIEAYRKLQIGEKVEIHQTDAANIDHEEILSGGRSDNVKLPDGSVQLVYMHDVIEHIENLSGIAYPDIIPQKVLDIFREISRILAPKGHLFILDSRVTPELGKALRRMGFERAQNQAEIPQADIWRKAA
jgi:SAM-dependent methyltransferase